MLDSYDVVILGETALSAAQAQMLTTGYRAAAT